MLNAGSPHVTLDYHTVMGEVNPGETECKVLFMAPVGEGNLTIGYNISPKTQRALPDFFIKFIVLPVHIKIVNPNNQTILEEDITTPVILPVNFDTRGEYKVYLTNNGLEANTIGIGTIFERDNPQNREADKYLISLVAISIGAIFIVAGLTLNLTSKLINNSKSNKKGRLKQ